jgi:hypothetical protein
MRANCRFLIAGQGRLAVAILAILFMRSACAGDVASGPVGRAWQDFDAASLARALAVPLTALQPLVTSAVAPTEDDLGGGATAQELVARLDVRVQQKRRKFRAEAIDWLGQQSVAMGRMGDFLLGGADSGLHLVVDPIGADEYVLEWKVRFR